jgi:hypothetical protein
MILLSREEIARCARKLYGNGEEREVRVLATGRRPLIGTALLVVLS